MILMKNTKNIYQYSDSREIKALVFAFISFLLIIFPTFLPLGFSPDSLSYYSTIKLSPIQYNFLQFEPFYWLIVYINQILFNGSWISFLLFFSATYVILSVYLIKKYSASPIISFIIFILLFYPNFGLIQIRNGISIAFVWWALFNLLENNRLKFITKIIIATLFHYASIIFILVLLINKNHINKKFFVLLPLAGFLLGQYVFNIGFYQSIVNYLPVFLKFKVQSYINIKMMYGEQFRLNKIHLINMYTLFILIIYYIGLLIRLNNRYFIILEKLVGFGLFSWFSLSIIAVFSFRISNDLFSFIVFSIPYILKVFKKEEKYLVYYSAMLALILISWNMYIRNDLFNFSVLRLS